MIAFLCSSPAWSSWKYCRTLLLDIDSSVASAADTLFHFPLLIRLDSSHQELASVRSDVRDLRFVDVAGDSLPFEVEEWDPLRKTAALWVSCDTIYGGRTGQTITAYWGDGAALPASAPGRVFDTAFGYAGVWHLGENLLDATWHGNEGMDSGTADAAGVIGRARVWERDSTCIHVNHHPALDESASLNLSAWVNPALLDGRDRGILSKRMGPDVDEAYALFFGADNNLYLELNGTAGRLALPGGPLGTSTWHWVSVSFAGGAAGGSIMAQVNGEALSSFTVPDTIIRRSYAPLLFGRGDWDSAASFRGGLDEIRVERVARTGAWTRLRYQAERPGSTLVRFGPVDSNLADVKIWDGGGVTLYWHDRFNWVGDMVPGPSDRVLFSGRSVKNCILVVAVTVASITITPFYTGGVFIRDSLTVREDAYFSGQGVVDANAGHLCFAGGGEFQPGSRSIFSEVSVAGSGRLTLRGALAAGRLVLLSGGLELGEGNTHTVAKFLGRGGLLNFQTSTLRISGDTADFSHTALGSWQTGRLELSSAAGQLLFPPATDTLPAILHDGGGQLTPAGGQLRCQSFTQTEGRFDMGGLDLVVVEDFAILNGRAGSLAGLARRTLYAGGEMSLRGQSGDTLRLDPDEPWNLDAQGGISAGRCALANANATNAPGQAWASVDLGGNGNWTFEAEDYAEWTHERRVQVNTRELALQDPVLKFPLLVRLDSMFAFGECLGTGADLRFAAADGSHLPYVIDLWDTAGRQAAVRVLVPEVVAGGGLQYFSMHWGRAGAVPRSDSSDLMAGGDTLSPDWMVLDSAIRMPGSRVLQWEGPRLSGPDDPGVLEAAQNSRDSVKIRYLVLDFARSSVQVSVELRSLPNGAWFRATRLTGAIGNAVPGSDTGVQEILWAARRDAEAAGGWMQVRLIAAAGAAADTLYSAPGGLLPDFFPPTGLGGFRPVEAVGPAVTLAWDPAQDRAFDHYAIWYGTDSGAVTTRQPPALKWGPDQDPRLGWADVPGTFISGLSRDTLWRFRLVAVDDWGNEFFADTFALTGHAPAPVWRRDGFGLFAAGVAVESRIYAVSGGNHLYSFNAADGGMRWQFRPPGGASVGRPAVWWSSSGTRMIFSAGDSLYGLTENPGLQSLFSPLPLGGSVQGPVLDREGDFFLLAYGGRLEARSTTTGRRLRGWPVALPAGAAQLAETVEDDVVTLVTGNGMVLSHDLDGTPLAKAVSGIPFARPPVLASGALYLTSRSQVIAKLQLPGLQPAWNAPLILPDSVSLPVVAGGDGTLYAGSGSYVQAVGTDGASGSVLWRRYLGSPLVASLLVRDSTLFAATADGRRHALRTDNGVPLSGWPYAGDSSLVTGGPWSPPGGDKVIFGSETGVLDAFKIE